jgi:hypothetical protein
LSCLVTRVETLAGRIAAGGCGGYNYIVQGEEGIVTGNLGATQKELARLSENYGWTLAGF